MAVGVINKMGITADIRKELTVCHDCVNCKLAVWSSEDDSDKVAERNDIATYLDTENDEKYHYAVHCSWLKQKMLVAQKLIKCEGKKQE